MNNLQSKANNLMNKQMEVRGAMIDNLLSTIDDANNALNILGYTNKTNNETAVKVVEKVVKVEVPVEIPTKELEDLKISNSELQAIIKGLETQIKETENNAKKIAKEKAALEAENKTLKDTNTNLVEENKQLESKTSMYKNLVKDLKDKMSTKKEVVETNKKKSQAKVHKEVEAPVVDNKELTNVKAYDTYVTGKYKGVTFEASKNMDAITIYDPKRHDLKAEINELLVKSGVLNVSRVTKDIARVENELGVCHEIARNKYMGYVMFNNKPVCFIFDKGYNNGNGTPTVQKLEVRLKNPTKAYRQCKGKTAEDKQLTALINDIIDVHLNKEQDYTNSKEAEVLSFLGINKKKEEVVEQPKENTVMKEAAITVVDNNEVKEDDNKQETGADLFGFDTGYGAGF